jgi:hypothetical protein
MSKHAPSGLTIYRKAPTRALAVGGQLMLMILRLAACGSSGGSKSSTTLRPQRP